MHLLMAKGSRSESFWLYPQCENEYLDNPQPKSKDRARYSPKIRLEFIVPFPKLLDPVPGALMTPHVTVAGDSGHTSELKESPLQKAERTNSPVPELRGATSTAWSYFKRVWA